LTDEGDIKIHTPKRQKKKPKTYRTSRSQAGGSKEKDKTNLSPQCNGPKAGPRAQGKGKNSPKKQQPEEPRGEGRRTKKSSFRK